MPDSPERSPLERIEAEIEPEIAADTGAAASGR